MQRKGIIDLRSDTVTLPTAEMLEATRHAELGDDVYCEDPTVNHLQELAAKKTGKEAALLLPSGTMANLVSLMSNCKRGELVVLESESHIYWYEVGGVSAVAGLLPWLLKSSDGALDPAELEAAIRPRNIHFPEPSLVCIEDTHNRHGGTIITPNKLEAISKVAKRYSLKMYLDGARIFNAAVAMQTDVKEFTRHTDNLMFSLSKGLCCPVGSLVVGDLAFIEKARKVRKMLGGGMRQAGVIAAPGIVALEKMVDRLKEDHENARFLASKLSNLEGIQIDLGKVQTNIVSFNLVPETVTDELFLSKLRENNIYALAQSKNKIRMVTHYGIKREHVEAAVSVIEQAMHTLTR
jgi:threonine aldolase